MLSRTSHGNKPPIKRYSNSKSNSSKGTPSGDEVASVNYFDLEKGNVLVNMFPIQLQPTVSIKQYHIKIDPPVDNRYLSNRIVKQVLSEFPINYIQSDSILYSLTSILPPQTKFMEKTCSIGEIVYMVVFSFATTITVSKCEKDFMQFVNCVLKRAQAKLKLIRIGRQYYNEKTKTILHDEKLEIFKGIMSTTCSTAKGLVLLTDSIYKCIPTVSILSKMNEIKDQFPKSTNSKIAQQFSNTIVYLSYRKQTIHIESVDFEKSPLSTFSFKGKEISFAEYYKQQYGIDNVNPNQPLLKHVNRKNGNIAYYIPSLCSVAGLSQDMKKNYKTMIKIKQVTKKTPNERVRETFENQVAQIENIEFKEELEKWGIFIVPKMIKMETSILQPNPIMIGNDIQVQMDQKNGLFNIAGPLFECKPLEKVLILHPGSRSKDVNPFFDSCKKMCDERNLDTSKLSLIFESYVDNNRNTLDAIITKHYPLSLIFMITKSKTSPVYNIMKELTITGHGIPSQCITEKNIAPSDKLPSILNNLVIEVNAKLGGIPWTTMIPLKKRTMIIGMDVNHSGEVYRRTKSSVVGFVSSFDSTACTYYNQILIQESGVELVKNIKILMHNAIENFSKMNKNKRPEHVIFYRDGVGSGQEDSIYEEEISAIQEVCNECENVIPLNFVLLKRNNNRIYACLDNEGRNFGNPKPGTILDGDLLSDDKGEMTFFLQSHFVAPSQGTTTPTKYKILLAESKFRKQYFKELSFKLCHLYYNRLGPSSVPVPCMLAHTLAFLHGQSNILNNPHENLRHKMYSL